MLALATALEAAAQPTLDVAYGEGFAFAVGAELATSAEVFPSTGVARFTTPGARIELFRQEPPRLGTQGVIFTHAHEGELTRVLLSPQGELLFSHALSKQQQPLEPVETPQLDAGGSETPSDVETPRSGDSTPPQTLPENRWGPGKEPQQRVTLFGLVGREPAMRTTQNGVTVARFPLAVRDDEQNTTWHTVVTFNERAKKLLGTLAKGQPVEVIGYLHEREKKLRNGKTRRVQEVYAAVVKPR